MYAIAAVVLGGIAMAGGRGNMAGVLFGALSYSAIDFIIVSIPALSADIQDTFQGLVLILVILVQTAGPGGQGEVRLVAASQPVGRAEVDCGRLSNARPGTPRAEFTADPLPIVAGRRTFARIVR